MRIDVLVSIIVPVYNMGTKVADSVHTLMKQTYDNIEIVLVDDGSQDNSLDVCTMLAKEDSRIKVYHTENRGSGPARNFGIAHASGAYLYFPDADDLLENTAIERLVDAIETSGADVVVFGYRSVDVTGKIASTKKYPSLLLDGNEVRKDYEKYYYLSQPLSIQGAPWNKFFKREIVEKFDVQYPALRRHQDDAFIARYVTHCNKIQFIEDILYTYYTNDLKKTWDKYPTTYLEAVIGLYEDRKKTILTWNSDDRKTHDLVVNEYICNAIKALELSFSAKYGFENMKDRLAWMLQNIEKTGLQTIRIPEATSVYQKTILCKIRRKQYRSMYFVLWFKVWNERSGLLQLIKRVCR